MVQAWLALLSISYKHWLTVSGRPWPPYSGSQLSAGPAAFDVLRVGLLEALGRGDGVVGLVQRAALGVAADVEREDHFGGELAGLFQHGVDGVGVEVGVRGMALELVDDLEHFVQHELHVAQGWGVAGHEAYSWNDVKVEQRGEGEIGSAARAVARQHVVEAAPARSMAPGWRRKRAS
jgi:hypothetical protein